VGGVGFTVGGVSGAAHGLQLLAAVLWLESPCYLHTDADGYRGHTMLTEMMAFCGRVESTPKQSVKKQRYTRCHRKYRMMEHSVHLDSALLQHQDM